MSKLKHIPAALLCATLAATPTVTSAADTATASPQDRIMNWAEMNWPDIFTPAGQSSSQRFGYYSRCYQTGACLAFTSDNKTWFAWFAQNTNWTDVGDLNQWLPFADAPYAYADQTVLPFALLNTVKDAQNQPVAIRNGGYGSAMAAHPALKGYFYALTDRGPNAATAQGVTPSGIIFVHPEYTPRIGLFKLNAQSQAELVREILLKDRYGRPISGLPNKSFGSTGETPYALGGTVTIDPDRNGSPGYDESGLDGEGLVAMKDGTFWVSDEYGPHIVHFDATGKEIERINPFRDDPRNQAGRFLPPELAKRWPNRGMEGLAITPDETTLVGIMQSSLDNPNRTLARDSDLTRIVTVNLKTGAVAQYLYRQDAKGLANSEIVALSDNTFLVIERDGKFLGRDAAPVRKNVYKIDLTGATNVDRSNKALLAAQSTLSIDDETGLLVNGKTLEQYIKDEGTKGWGALQTLGIVPVRKELAYDAVAGLGYLHDKLEGLWVIDHDTLGLINDDDFALEPDNQGGVKQKILSNGQVDGNTLYIVKPLVPLN